jgi:hypothetical protein
MGCIAPMFPKFTTTFNAAVLGELLIRQAFEYFSVLITLKKCRKKRPRKCLGRAFYAKKTPHIGPTITILRIAFYMKTFHSLTFDKRAKNTGKAKKKIPQRKMEAGYFCLVRLYSSLTMPLRIVSSIAGLEKYRPNYLLKTIISVIHHDNFFLNSNSPDVLWRFF